MANDYDKDSTYHHMMCPGLNKVFINQWHTSFNTGAGEILNGVTAIKKKLPIGIKVPEVLYFNYKCRPHHYEEEN